MTLLILLLVCSLFGMNLVSADTTQNDQGRFYGPQFFYPQTRLNSKMIKIIKTDKGVGKHRFNSILHNVWHKGDCQSIMLFWVTNLLIPKLNPMCYCYKQKKRNLKFFFLKQNKKCWSEVAQNAPYRSK